VATWTKKYDTHFHEVFTANESYSKRVIDIAYKNKEKPRKDMAVWSDVKSTYSYFYDDFFNVVLDCPENLDKNIAADILKKYSDIYTVGGDSKAWFERLKEFAKSIGFASTKAEYKKNPSAFYGTVADVATLLRYATTGQYSAPDLYDVFCVIGEQRVKERFLKMAASLLD